MKNGLKFIEKLFLSVTCNKALLKTCLEKKELLPLCADIQNKILDVTIQNPYCIKYSPPASYQKFFLRALLDAVESNGCELSDRLVEAYANIIAVSNTTDYFYRSYIIEDDCAVTLQESSCFVANSTTGFQTWEASKYLLEWCLHNKMVFKNKKILELGCGIGLLGITIVKTCQPQNYLFTDKSLDVLNILTKNIEINLEDNIQKEVIKKCQLLWQNFGMDDAAQLDTDIILGADVVYDPSVVEDLAKTLKLLLIHSGASCAYIATAIRNMDTSKKFSTELGSAKLAFDVIDFKSKSLFIYHEASEFMLYRVFLKNK